MESRGERLAGLVAPAMLVLVALLSVWQTNVRAQSSWSGAGFGMFATIDGEATRQVRAYIKGTSRTLALPAGLERMELEIRVLPSPDRIEELGRAWASLSGLPGHLVLVVEVWAIDFEGATGLLTRSLLRRIEVDT